jgi:hypothetical protein
MKPRPLPAAPAAASLAPPLVTLAPAPRLARSATPPDLRPCTLCGRTHPRRMYGLMTHWYGRYIGLADDHGYFYLCPRCYAAKVRKVEEAARQRGGNPRPRSG